jgi:hypothetical protein
MGMRPALPVLLACTLPIAASAAPPHPLGPARPVAGSEISAAAIRAHMRFLADDRLEGRGTATRGYDLAAAYVAAQFEAAGLSPGVGDSYYQQVPLRRGMRLPEETAFSILRSGGEERLEKDLDYLASLDFLSERVEVQAPLVFVGYGVTAKEQGYDDYAGLDVKGKIALRLYGAPASFPPTLRAHHSNTVMKARNAAAHGAVGTLEFRLPRDQARSPWARSIVRAQLPGFKWLDGAGQPNDTFPELRATFTLSPTGTERILKGAPQGLAEIAAAAEAGRLRGFALPSEVKLRTGTRHSAAHSPNVVGVLRGSDPRLAAEHIVYSAHLDHLGTLERANTDGIHNGALDNTTGIASLIEIARAFAAQRPAPRRTIVFLAVTGEENGLLGSSYFAQRPTVTGPLVANLNMDMILALYPARDLVVLGAEHSSLGPVVTRVARRLGFELSPDPLPEEVRFVRSDQYSFVKRGVPAINVNQGPRSTDPTRDGPALTAAWLKQIYHTPQDDLGQRIDYETLARLARVNWMVGREVADAPLRPRWNAGDFFGTTFGSGGVQGGRGAGSGSGPAVLPGESRR